MFGCVSNEPMCLCMCIYLCGLLNGGPLACVCVCVCVCAYPPVAAGRGGQSDEFLWACSLVFQLCALHRLSKTTMQGNLSAWIPVEWPAKRLNTKGGEHTHTHTKYTFTLAASHTDTLTPLGPVVPDDLWPVHYPFGGTNTFLGRGSYR